MAFLKNFHQNNLFLGNDVVLKIWLLQFYEVLWIDDIDAICIFGPNAIVISELHYYKLDIFWLQAV